MQGLRVQLTFLVSALEKSSSDDVNAETVTRNFEIWSDGLFESQKELLLEAIKVRSSFTIQMVHWITGITEILLAASKAPACKEHTRGGLAKNAGWLVSVFTWIPDDEETIRFVENFQLTEALFECAQTAFNRKCRDVGKEIVNHLLSWTLRGGKYQTGWNILEKGLCGYAVLSLLSDDDDGKELKSALEPVARDAVALDPAIRARTALKIKARAVDPLDGGYGTSSIEVALAKSDPQKIRLLLQEIAEVLSPEVN